MNIGSTTTLDERQSRRYCLNNLQDPESMDKDLICAICQDLVHEPLECIKCQHVFCTECIEDWHKKKDKCPFDCKGILELQPVHRFVRNCLSKLRVSCPDCKEVFPLEKSNIHDKECQYAKIECDHFGCTFNSRRKSMEKHKNICEFSDKNNCKKCIYLKQFFTQELKKTQQELIECKKLLKIEIQDKGKLLQQQQKQIYGTIQYCNQGHQLAFFEPNYNSIQKQYNQFQCSICNQEKYCRYQCKQTGCSDKKYCTTCRPLKFDRIYCPNRHKLKPRNVIKENHICDVCLKQSKNNFTCTMYCNICSVDICSNCYDKLEAHHHY